MKIADIDMSIIGKLRESGISTEMKSLESCDWIVFEEENKRIIGAAGMGGLFHVSGIQISKEYRGKGLGKILQSELINEAKRRGCLFVTVFNDPRNMPSERLHNSLGYKTIFRIHYSEEIVSDVKILTFKSRGKIVEKFLGVFNTRLGIFFLACLLKVSRSLFRKIILYSEENIPEPSIRSIVMKFEKM